MLIISRRRFLNIERFFGFRNLIAHGYDIIDDTALWDFVVNRGPRLLEQVQHY
ncbi:MAG: DUF86 domain-containing protein [Opitutaceae bacterium]|nr:DUF86 domain-containing protein [Opitutaceae bacterium]